MPERFRLANLRESRFGLTGEGGVVRARVDVGHIERGKGRA